MNTLPIAWKERGLHGLVAGYLFLITIQWSPFPHNIQFSDLLFIALSLWALFIFPGFKERENYAAIRRIHPLDLLVLGYIAGSLISLWGSPNRGLSALAAGKQFYLVAVYLIFARLAHNPERQQKIAVWFSIVAVWAASFGVAVLAAYYCAGAEARDIGRPMPIPYLGTLFRVQGMFHSHEMYGDYLTLSIPLLIGLSLEAQGAWIRRIGLGLSLAALLGTISRAWVGSFLAVWFFLRERWNRGLLKALRIGLGILTVILFLGIGVVSTFAIREWKMGTGWNSDIGPAPYVYAFRDPKRGTPRLTLDVSYNWMSYHLLKEIALRAFLEKPITGIGLGLFEEATEQAYRQGKIHSAYRRMAPHCSLLGRLAETGLVGGAGLLLLWIGIVGCGLSAVHRAGPSAWLERALVAGFLGLFINSFHVDIMNFRFFWIGLGLLVGSCRSLGPKVP